MRDYFDLLPVRPEPLPFESLTSYIGRLGDANGFVSRHQFVQFCFPDESSTFVHEFTGLNLRPLADVTGFSVHTLLPLTFQPLVRRFYPQIKRSTITQALIHMLVSHRRYCPQCLSEHGYDSLLWRFNEIRGCLRHDCALVEVCPHCQQSLPYLSVVLAMHGCPHCGQDLRTAQPDAWSDDDRQWTAVRQSDYTFLMGMRQPDERQQLGTFLQQHRLAAGHTETRTARDLAIRLYVLRRVERDHPRGLTTLVLLQRYADYLGLSMQQVFHDITQPHPYLQSVTSQTTQRMVIEADQRETQLLQQTQVLVQDWLSKQVNVTKTVLSRALHIDHADLNAYPRVLACLQHAQAQQHEVEEDRLIAATETFVQQQIERDQPIRKMDLMRHLHCKYSRIQRCYPRLLACVHRVLQDEEARQHDTRRAFIAHAQQRMEHLLSQDENATLMHLEKDLGLTVGRIRNYPEISRLWQQAQQQYQQREPQKVPSDLRLILAPDGKFDHDVLLQYVEKTLHEFEQMQKYPGQAAIAAVLGISPMVLGNRPVIHERIRKAVSQYWQADEARLLDDVQQTIQRLHTEGKPVTQNSIVQTLGIPYSRLTRYPTVNALMTELVEAKQRAYELERASRPERMRAAIQQLKEEGAVITQEAVAERIGLKVCTLAKNPETRAVFDELKSLKRGDFHQRDEQLVQEAFDAIAHLQATGVIVTQKAIAQVMGHTPRGLKYYPRLRMLLKDVVAGKHNTL